MQSYIPFFNEGWNVLENLPQVSCRSALKGFEEKRTSTKTGTGFVYDPSTG